ncbi:MAG TPA: SDR family NAD(P)-dependent oxidoreductase, partial [Micromonosporaceae bacterium]|nr:SDR family NAD(P)-dependent oxidoreductase [Micromonosporaceae bacterium]
RAVDRLAGHLAAQPEADLADVAYTLRVGRGRHRHRAAVVATDTADAVAGLRDKKRRHTAEAHGVAPRVAFLFSGQGAQFAGMAAQLYQVEPVFREAVDSCAEVLRPELDGDLREWMFSTGDQQAEERLRQTRYTQPALFVVDYALARLWESWGVRPSAMIGHSIGEYVAATLAGVFALADALRLVAARGRLMQELPAGAMLAVQAGEERVAAGLPEGLSVAVVNGPGTCVVAGPPDDVARYAESLRERKIGSRPLRTSHAFHSPMMDPILEEFTALVAAVPRQVPQAPFLSNRTGDWVTAEQATDPAYWAGHLRHTVRFGECVARLLGSDDDWVMVECGPGRQLTGLARMQVPKGGAAPLPSLPGPGDRKGDLQVLYDAAGRLWVAGVELDDAFGGPGRRVPLPTYPFERSYHWVEPEPGTAEAATPVQAGPPRNLPMSQWCSVPVWHQLPPVAETTVPARCLVFADGPAGAGLAGALAAGGAVVTQVVPGTGYGRDEQGRFTVRRTERDDYVALLEELGRGGGVPARIVHAWCLADDGAAPTGDAGVPGDAALAAAAAAQDRGFFSLLALSQALGAVDLPEPVHLDVVTAGTRDVVGGDVTRPEHATVAGIVMVLPLELPGTVSVRHIDADPALGAAAGAAAAGEVRVPPAGEQGDIVALRRGRRWRPTLTSVPLPSGGSGLRTGGVYLVTGGLGGIGLTLAEDLAAQVGARLVLLSRTPLPPREEWDAYLAGAAAPGGGDASGAVDAANGAAGRTARSITAIRRIEAAGGEVLVLPADVADVASLRRVREEVLARFGRLDGIVHAAGLPGGGLVEARTRAAAEVVLAPKLAGSLALAAAFGDLDLDFVALCSSVTGVYGGLGQVDYCAASAFLDAFAHSGKGFSGRVLSIDWGGWLEVGMAVDVVAPDVLGETANVRTGVTAALPAEPVDHPLVTSRHGSGGGPAWCAGLLDPSRHWVLSEHRIAGTPVMPGTGHLELARAAVAAVVPRPSADAVVQLRDVTFLRPLAVADGSVAEVRVLLEPIDDGMAFQVTSGGEVYADGTGGWVVPGPASALDLDAVRARCGPAQDLLAGHYESITGLLTFGPRWASLRRIQAGDGEALGLFEAPDQVAAELDQWPLHPAVLDEATSFAGGEGGNRLPLGYGRVTVHRTMPPRVWAHARTRGAGGELETSDILLVDDDGRVVTEITDFMLRRVDPDAVATSVTERPTEVTERLAEAPADTIGIRPAEGAEVFRRLLSADLGAQVVVAARAVADSIARVRAVTTQTVAEQLDKVRSGGGPGGEGGRAAGTELESVLAAVWSQVLGVADVGPDDDFFELGGNSLVAVQLIGQVRKAVNVRLPMRSLFEASTVAAMAALVEQLRGAEETAAEPAPAAPAVTIPRLARPE